MDTRIPKYYTVEQVGEMLGFSAKTIRRYIKDGSLEAVRFRTEYRITQKNLDDYMEKFSTKNDQTKLDTAEGDPKSN